MKLKQFTSKSGQPVAVNPENVDGVEVEHNSARTRIYLGGGQVVVVTETYDQVCAALEAP